LAELVRTQCALNTEIQHGVQQTALILMQNALSTH